MRVAICWAGMSGYMAACWRALQARDGLDVKVFFVGAGGKATNAPFAGDVASGLTAEAMTREQSNDPAYVALRVAAHRPDVVVIPGWALSGFVALPFRPEFAQAKFVMAIDTPRKRGVAGALRQWVGKQKLRRLLARMDRIVVPGERSWQYARALGFEEGQIHRGVYGVDVAHFDVAARRRAEAPQWPRRFLFAGRYEPEKGVDVLASAYEIYRRQHGADDAWPLTCSGKGSLGDRLRNVVGVEDVGFVQPADQPDLWSRCGAFVLASRYDPWPLVIVEACAAGLPVLCTEACGSSVELVRSHFNGLTVASGDAHALARGLSFIHHSYDLLPEMGRRGQALAAAYSADVYADRWEAMFRDLRGTEA